MRSLLIGALSGLAPTDNDGSNTKVSLFQAYSTAVQPFRSVVNSTPAPNPFATLAKLDQEKTCHLHHAADMLRALTDGIVKMDQVYPCRGQIVAANQAGSVSIGHFFVTWQTVRLIQRHVDRELDGKRPKSRFFRRDPTRHASLDPLYWIVPDGPSRPRSRARHPDAGS